MDASGDLPRILEVAGKGQLRVMVRRWYEESDAITVGDVASFGGRRAVVIGHGRHTPVLDVDTKRRALAA